MGVINVTPDSFSDGGRYLEPARAVDHALHMVAEGADILDIGGESTRPGSEPVSVEEELRRTLPVIEQLAHTVPVPISIDTCKAEVARRLSKRARRSSTTSADSVLTRICRQLRPNTKQESVLCISGEFPGICRSIRRMKQ